MQSCGGEKADMNGDLDGMWQMTEWWHSDPGESKSMIADKQTQIYYSFQLTMVKFQRYSCEPHRFIQGMFQQDGSVLKIYNPLTPAKDHHEDYRDMKELSDFGVPESGIFHIIELNASRMRLVTPEGNDSLCFRKY